MAQLRALLEWLARRVLGRRRFVLVAALTLTILSPTWILGLRVHADTAALVPRDDQIVASYRRFAYRFGEPNDLVVRIPMAGIDRVLLDEWTETMGATISGWPDILEVRSSKLPGNPLDAAWELRAGLLNAGEAGRQALMALLDPEEIRRAALRTRRRVLTVGDPGARNAATADPLGVLEKAARSVEARQPPLRLAPSGDFLDSVEETSRLLIIRPAGSAEDGAYCRELLARIQGEAMRLAEESGMAPIEVEFAGLHAMTAGTMAVVFHDLGHITLVAAAGLLLLLWFCFRSWHWLLLIFGPLIVAQVVYLGLVRLAIGPINYLSIGFAAIVLGLGLDFGLHLAARLGRQRQRLGTEEAIVGVMGDAGPPIVVAAMTTAAAFACLSFSTIPYLVQFGWLTSLGLLVTLLVTLLVFPALAVTLPPAAAALSQRPFFGRAGRKAAATLSRRSGVFAAAGTVLAALSIVWAVGFRFEMDLMRLFPRDLAAAHTENLLQEEFGGLRGTPLLLTLSGSDLDAVLSAQAELDTRLIVERAAGRVVGFISPSSWLVSPEVDLDRDDWDALAEGALAGIELLHASFDDLGLRWGSELQHYGDLVIAAATRPSPLRDATDLDSAPAPIRQLVSFGDEADEGVVAVATRVLVRNTEGRTLADAEAVRRLADELDRFLPPAGIQLETAAITEAYGRVNESIRGEFLRLSLIALVVVLVLTYAFLRDLRMALICFVPLFAAVPATLALARLGGFPLTPATVGIAAVVIGIGVDDAIHLIVRRVKQPPQPVASILEEILPVITLTTVSTTVGFGALALATLEPTRSVGLVTAGGVVFAWLFSWMLLPWLLQRTPHGRWPAPSETHKAASASVLLLLPFFLVVGSQSLAAEQNMTTEQILEELRGSLDSMEAVSADLRQRVSYQQLTGEVELEGTLFFQKPNLFRLELKGEQNLRVLSDGEQIWLVDLDLEEVEVWDVAEIEAAERLTRLFPLLNVFTPEEMQRDFEVTSVEAERGEHRLALVPRTPSHSMVRMLIELDGRFRPVWARVEYPNGDSLEIDFDGWDRRGAVSRHFFQEIRD